MSPTMFIFIGLVAILLLLLAWALRSPAKLRQPELIPNGLQDIGKRHVSFLPQIQHALRESDYQFLSQRGPKALVRRVRQERRRIGLAYLSALREDFQCLLRMATIIAKLSHWPRCRNSRGFA